MVEAGRVRRRVYSVRARRKRRIAAQVAKRRYGWPQLCVVDDEEVLHCRPYTHREMREFMAWAVAHPQASLRESTAWTPGARPARGHRPRSFIGITGRPNVEAVLW
jgi:hypothetical protein